MISHPSITAKLSRWIAEKRYLWACFLYECRERVPYGDPMLGATREERDRNLAIMRERREVRAPKPEHFGLPPGRLVGGRFIADKDRSTP